MLASVVCHTAVYTCLDVADGSAPTAIGVGPYNDELDSSAPTSSVDIGPGGSPSVLHTASSLSVLKAYTVLCATRQSADGRAVTVVLKLCAAGASSSSCDSEEGLGEGSGRWTAFRVVGAARLDEDTGASW